jgi:hypothetical protein
MVFRSGKIVKNGKKAGLLFVGKCHALGHALRLISSFQATLARCRYPGTMKPIDMRRASRAGSGRQRLERQALVELRATRAPPTAMFAGITKESGAIERSFGRKHGLEI